MNAIKLSFFLFASFLFSLFSEKPLEDFNVVVKDLAVAGKTVRISPFKDIGVITVCLCFKNAGEKISPKGKECLVSLLSRAFGETTTLKNHDQLQNYSREHNIHIGASSDDDNFTITTKCTPDKLPKLFALLKELLFHSRFDKEDLDRFKKETIAATTQAMQSPNTLLSQLMKSTVLKNHPYGTLNITYLESLKNIHPDDLQNFLKKYFTQENLVISACGDIDEEKLAAEIAALIKELPKSFKAPATVDIKLSGPFKTYNLNFPVPQTVIKLLHEGYNFKHPDFFALHIAINCLSIPFDGTLWKKVREEKGLVYCISAGVSMKDHYNAFAISTSTSSARVEQTLSTIKNTLTDTYKDGFSPELIELSKKSFIGNFKRSFSSTGEIANRLTYYQLEGFPIDRHQIVIEKISALTPEEVNEAFRRFIKLDQFMIFMVGQ